MLPVHLGVNVALPLPRRLFERCLPIAEFQFDGVERPDRGWRHCRKFHARRRRREVAVFEQPLDVSGSPPLCIFPFRRLLCRPWPYLTYHHFSLNRWSGSCAAPSSTVICAGGYAVGVKLSAVHETRLLLVSNLVDGRLGAEMLGNRLHGRLSAFSVLQRRSSPRRWSVSGRSSGSPSGPA